MRWPLILALAFALWAAADLALRRVPGWPEAVGLGLLVGGLVWAAGDLRAQGFVRATCRGRADRPAVALTFDDGPDRTTTRSVLALLRDRHVKATFFVVGEKAARCPEILREMRDQGHEIGTHGDRHDWRAILTPRRARVQVQRGVERVTQALGEAPRYFRPPFGVTTPALGVALARAPLVVVGWSIRLRDARGKGDPGARARWAVARTRPGDILLLHDAPEVEGGRPPLGPALLPELIVGLQARGFALVTISDLVGRSTT